MIKYSIILTTLNEERNLLTAMDQFTRFKRNDFEVIVVDGGSTDGTVNRIKSRKYPFSLILKEGNWDLNTSRNVGVDVAKGEIVSIASVDNVLPENYLDRLDRYYNEGYDVVLCLYELPTKIDTWQGNWAYAQRRLLYDGKENTDEFLWTEGFSFRKEFAKRIRFPFINKQASGAEGWFGKHLKDAGAKIAYATDIDVKHAAPSSLVEFIQERKNRTRGTVFMEYYVYKFSRPSILARAFGRAAANLLMFVFQLPSLVDALQLYQRAKYKGLKCLLWLFLACQVDLLARLVGKLEAMFAVLTAKR